MFEQLIMVIAVLGGLLILLWVASNALKLELFPDLGKASTNVQEKIGEIVTAPFKVFTEKQKYVATELEKSGANLALVLGAPVDVFTAGQKKVALTLEGILTPKERDPMTGSWAQTLNPEEFREECEKYGVNPYPEFSEPQTLTVQEKSEILALFPVETKYERETQLQKRAILKSEEVWA